MHAMRLANAEAHLREFLRHEMIHLDTCFLTPLFRVEATSSNVVNSSTKLRAQDAIHLTVAHNNHAEFVAMLDEGMLFAASPLISKEVTRISVYNNFVLNLLESNMKNVTVTMAEDALEWVRVKAARDNASISRYLGQLVEQARTRDGIYERSMRAALKFQPLVFPKNTRYLSRDVANGRADIR